MIRKQRHCTARNSRKYISCWPGKYSPQDGLIPCETHYLPQVLWPPPSDGYRGVYHRARIRATRWLHPSCGPLKIFLLSPAVVTVYFGSSTVLEIVLMDRMRMSRDDDTGHSAWCLAKASRVH